MRSDVVVMITGAAGALGRAVAAAYEAGGASLLLIDADTEALQQLFPANPRRLCLAADLLDAVAVQRVVAAGIERFGRIDVLCNIAGGFYWGEPVHETRIDVLLQQFNLNATTAVQAVRAVVPGMLVHGDGCVFNVGAAGHVQGRAHTSAYAASKSAVMRLTEALAEELRGTGVRAFCLMPHIIDTAKNRADMPDADFREWTPPEEIAALMLLLSDPAAALMSGSSIALTGRPVRAG